MRHAATVPRLLLAAVGLASGSCGALDDLLKSPNGLAIKKFTVSPSQVSPGGTVTLSWNVEGADSVQIDNGVGPVNSKGSVEVRPTRTATYSLTARAGSSAASSTLQVLVNGSAASPSPQPSPSLTPAPLPTPTPSPSATPTPSPSTPPASSSCQLPAMPECGAAEGPKGVWGCCREERDTVFEDKVNAAIDKLLRERPQLFDGDRPKDADAYVRGVAEILQRDFGVCARQGGPDDEVGVKNSNGFNEQYDILFGNGRIRYSGYTVTCRPARF